MSDKQWYLNLGAVLFAVQAIFHAIAGHIPAAVACWVCICLVGIIADKNREKAELVLTLEIVRAELTNDNPMHPDALSKEHLTAIVCDSLKGKGAA